MKRKLQIRIWKAKLRSRWNHYNALRDRYSCGATLAEFISNDVWRARESVNEAIKKLRNIDPACTLKPLS